MRRMIQIGVLFAALVGFAFAAALSAAPRGHAIGLWPVGLAAGVMLVTERRFVVPVAIATALVGWMSISVARPPSVALGYGISLGVEVIVVRAILLAGSTTGRWRLRNDIDLGRWLLAAASGAGIGATGGAITSQLTGFGRPEMVALAIGTAQTASLLVLLPLFARLPRHGSTAPPHERILQWTTLVVVTLAVFARTDGPSLTFLVVPVLAWAALRIRPLEAMAQLVVTLAFAVMTTTFNIGPFAAAVERFSLDPDVRGVLLALYASTCALLVVPLVVRVGTHIEAARRAAAERDTLNSIVRSTTGVAIIGTDHGGLITLFNPGAERLLGWRAEEVIGLDTRMLHTEAQWRAKAAELGAEADYQATAMRLMDPDMAGTELGFVRKDGVERVHSVTMGRIVDDRGGVVGFLSTSEDITERLIAQQALEEALDQMRELDTLKDAFVSSVSHELRTPITSITGYLEMLTDGSFGELSPPQRRAIGRVSDNSHRLLALIDDLLVLSRLNEDGLGVSEKVLDLRSVVEASCAVVAPAAEHQGLLVEVVLPEEPVPFLGSRELLERVVLNLVGNAVKFTPSGGRVSVGLRATEGGCELSVADTGIGIPEAELPQVFSRFFRSSLAQKEAIKGSGLGLSIAHAVVQQYGGRITVDSRAGQGAVFMVWLPGLA